MTIRYAIYARYSSDLQSQSSIEDQIRLCQSEADKKNWSHAANHCFSDAAISGASMMRPGLQSLLINAQEGAFDVIVVEALDRLSRDQADIAQLYRQLTYDGIKIFTLAEGEINEMHIGLKGTMNQLFLKDLRQKTHRGLSGKIQNKKSAGGIGYGYEVVKHFDAQGNPIKGDREVNQEQAEIVLRIFDLYAHQNISPKKIAFMLNEEKIPSPSGGEWTQSTINGNRKRGTGILNNELYIGELVWNRQKFIKNPNTGKRVTRMNEEKDWQRENVPELRIVPQELWDCAKARQKSLDRTSKNLVTKKRPQYLLSGLLQCGECGGGFSKINSERYGCSTARNKGTCTNRQTIKRERVENAVISALQTHLMRDELIDV